MTDIVLQCNQPGHISRDCTNDAVEGAGRGGGGYQSGGSQECYKVRSLLRHILLFLTKLGSAVNQVTLPEIAQALRLVDILEDVEDMVDSKVAMAVDMVVDSVLRLATHVVELVIDPLSLC